MAVIRKVRRAIERMSGLSIYRHAPRGLNLYKDLAEIPAPAPQMVFDVGAHRGESAAEFLRVWKDGVIHCFEPSTESFEALQARFSTTSTVSCHRLALGDREHDGTLYIRSGSVNNSLRNYEGRSAGEVLVGEEKVAVKTLDKFCVDADIGHIDFLKIDTEGGDMEVLIGAEKLLDQGAIGALQVEVGLDPENAKHVPLGMCMSQLREFEYRLFGIYEQVHEFQSHRWHLRRCNAVFISDKLTRASSGRK